VKERHEIDLLPEWARNAKARKSLITKLALVQVALFVLMIAGIFLLREADENARANVMEIYARISARSTAPVEVARELETARAQTVYIEEFFADFLPACVAANALDSVYLATPEGVNITRISYERGEILITGEAEDLLCVEEHRATLSYAFMYVHMGRITRADNVYTYEIRLSSIGTG
jgi:hypothetical protein